MTTSCARYNRGLCVCVSFHKIIISLLMYNIINETRTVKGVFSMLFISLKPKYEAWIFRNGF